MAGQSLRTCTICSKPFAPRPRKPNKYCGLDCYRAAQRRGDYKRGPQKLSRIHACWCCGVKVVKTQTKDRKGRRCEKVFCSRRCYDAFRVEQRGFCRHCGDRLPPLRGRAAVYCSWACRLEAQKPRPRNCVNCGCLFTPVKPIRRSKGFEFVAHDSGKTCSAACALAWISNNEERKRKIGAAFRGTNHPNWQGGKSHQGCGYRGPDWLKIAERARKRDGYKCQRCGVTQDDFGSRLDVHHIRPYHNFRNSREANRLGNLTTLCRPCHRAVEWQVPEQQIILPFVRV